MVAGWIQAGCGLTLSETVAEDCVDDGEKINGHSGNSQVTLYPTVSGAGAMQSLRLDGENSDTSGIVIYVVPR